MAAPPTTSGLVLSYVVENLREVMERLRSAGIELERIKEHAYGPSAWIPSQTSLLGYVTVCFSIHLRTVWGTSP